MDATETTRLRARSLREPSPGLGLGLLLAVRPPMAGRKRQEKETENSV